MSVRLVLVASAALVLAAPALAQEPAVAPATPAPAAAQPSAGPSAEFIAAVARIEAQGTAIEAVMTDLEPRAAAVRADASLSDADKETRIRAMIAEHQPAFDAFAVALADLIRLSAMNEGASAEDAAAAAAETPARMMAVIEQSLITGETDDEDGHDASDDAAGHEGH